MFLAEPQETAYDLRFHIAGIPVRVHPLFWLMTLVLGAQGRDGPSVLIWVAVVFASILIHELGHALMMRYFGEGARIVLYLMGGLAISDGSLAVRGPRRRGRTPAAQVLISAAGPGAGFLLAGVTVAAVFASGGSVGFHLAKGVIPVWDVILSERLAASPYVYLLIDDLLWVSVFWGLINLLPIFPLDGGQIARELLVQQDPWNGMANALRLSVIAGVAMALCGVVVLRDPYTALFFGSLAASSYQGLVQLGGGGRPY